MNGRGRLSQIIHASQLKLVFPPNNRLELTKYPATITQPQKASQVLSDNSITDLFISAEDENNPTETSVAENRTVMGNQQLIRRNWCELDTRSILPNGTRSGNLSLFVHKLYSYCLLFERGATCHPPCLATTAYWILVARIPFFM